MDVVTDTELLPSQGETVLGKDYFMTPGGKGANQAVAASRLGGDVSFIGKVGNDVFGDRLMANLQQNGVNTEGIESSETFSSGMANVLLKNQDNRIIVVPGANNQVTAEYAEHYSHILTESNIVLAQLEIPLSTIEWCSAFCHEHGIPFILNPAPAQLLPETLIKHSTYITPNEEEYTKINSPSIEKDYGETFITTLGAHGVTYRNMTVPAPQVKAIDTTGAGDTFNGALSYYLASGYNVEDALYLSNTAASFTVEHPGAQAGMPTWEQVRERTDKERTP
ncbi:ribokinase [Salibacterium halotolerans]|uniref:Deoxyribokinase n=2 Tax=Salibacterium halotolerans TaxID=1884432 RepID=A0A1I5KXW0_9BACI|nr:ribokinase [Salibacterium halotolerans]